MADVQANFRLLAERGVGLNRYRFARYGLTPSEALDLLESQGGLCAICGNQISFFSSGRSKAVIDHDHAAERAGEMKVRGVLCQSCNHAEGAYRSDVGSHINGAVYLLRAKGYTLGRIAALFEKMAVELRDIEEKGNG